MTVTIETVCIARPRSILSSCNCKRCTRQRNYIRRLISYGRYNRVRPDQALAVLDRMLADRWDGRAIATATGVPVGTANHWVKVRRRGSYINLGADSCRALAEAGEPTDGHIGGAAIIVAKRKLQALARLGWGVKELATAMQAAGLTTANQKSLLFDHRYGRRPIIEVKLLTAINITYQRLQMKAAPDDRHHAHVRNDAARKRWAPPLAWENIEDPDEKPTGRHHSGWDHTRHHESVDEVAVWRAASGDSQELPLTRAEKAAVVEVMREAGKTDREIERVTGIGQVGDRFPRKDAESNDSQDDQLSVV